MPRPWSLAPLLAALAAPALADDPASRPRVYELRNYVASPGKLDALNARFRDHTDGLFRKHGMTPVGYWTPAGEGDGRADTLVYLLAHEGREAAENSWAAFRDDPEWKRAKAESERDGVLTARVDSTFLDATDYSPDPGPSGRAPNQAPLVYELRTYVASPGKLDALHARFREHTLALFRKHGLENVAYFTPSDADKGRADTLIYFLATPTFEGSKAAWRAFLDDPEWQEVYKASQPDGVPLAGKVTSVYLVPTDYSPLK